MKIVNIEISKEIIKWKSQFLYSESCHIPIENETKQNWLEVRLEKTRREKMERRIEKMVNRAVTQSDSWSKDTTNRLLKEKQRTEIVRLQRLKWYFSLPHEKVVLVDDNMESTERKVEDVEKRLRELYGIDDSPITFV